MSAAAAATTVVTKNNPWPKEKKAPSLNLPPLKCVEVHDQSDLLVAHRLPVPKNFQPGSEGSGGLKEKNVLAWLSRVLDRNVTAVYIPHQKNSNRTLTRFDDAAKKSPFWDDATIIVCTDSAALDPEVISRLQLSKTSAHTWDWASEAAHAVSRTLDVGHGHHRAAIKRQVGEIMHLFRRAVPVDKEQHSTCEHRQAVHKTCDSISTRLDMDQFDDAHAPPVGSATDALADETPRELSRALSLRLSELSSSIDTLHKAHGPLAANSASTDLAGEGTAEAASAVSDQQELAKLKDTLSKLASIVDSRPDGGSLGDDGLDHALEQETGQPKEPISKVLQEAPQGAEEVVRVSAPANKSWFASCCSGACTSGAADDAEGIPPPKQFS